MDGKTIFSAILLLVSGIIGPAFADSVFDAQGVSLEIRSEATPQSATLRFPATVRKDGQKVCLSFRAYLKTDKPSGWNNYLGLRLNGQLLKKHCQDGELRLLRRGLTMQTNFSGPVGIRDWWRDNLLMVFFGPGQGELDARVIAPRQEGYDYLLDVSDLVNYVEPGADDRIESAKENVLVLTNTFVSSLLPSVNGKSVAVNMFIENLKIVYLPVGEVEKLRPPATALVTYTPSPAAAELSAPGVKATVTQGGGIVINVNGDTYGFASAFSYPSRPAMGFNTLTPDKASGVAGWTPRITMADGGKIQIEANSTAYSLKRTLSMNNGVLNVADTLTNKSAADIGIGVNYTLVAGKRLGVGQYFLGGNTEVERESGIADNPTVFVRQDRSSIGIAAADDVFRAHLEASRNANTVSMAEPHLGLRPGESYTLEYQIYPSSDPDYMSFVNRIRRDWKLNNTVAGPFCFGFGTKPEGLKIGISVPGPWFEYFEGKRYNRDQYREIVTKKIADIKKQDPNIKVLAKTECNLVTLDKTQLKDGGKLPFCGKMCEGEYGYKLNAEQSDIVSRTPYKDSLLRLADGRVLADTYYPADPLIQLLVQVEENNYRYREMLEQIDYLIDVVGFDGIYIDQFAAGCGGPLSRVDRCSYDRWDGRTVDLTPTGEIARKYYDYAVTGNAARAQITRHILDKNKIIVANTQPTSRLTAQLPAFRFHEMENDNIFPFIATETKPPIMRYQAKCQLSPSPVILGLRPDRYSKNPEDWARILHRGVITALRHGLLYYYYGIGIKPGTGGYGPVNHMFPFTPVELGEGFVIGRERIITAVSRKFVTAEKPSLCLRFDECGRETVIPVESVKVPDGWETTIKLKDWNETAVLILKEKS